MPKPPKTMYVAERQVTYKYTTVEVNGQKVQKKVPEFVKVKGPQAATYYPAVDQGVKRFKNGQREDSNDSICRKRHTLLYITALANVNMSIPDTDDATRMLQTVSTTSTSQDKVKLDIVIASEYFSSSASKQFI